MQIYLNVSEVISLLKLGEQTVSYRRNCSKKKGKQGDAIKRCVSEKNPKRDVSIRINIDKCFVFEIENLVINLTQHKWCLEVPISIGRYPKCVVHYKA